MRFSGLRILKEGLTGNKGWTPHWRDPEPKSEYDAIIIVIILRQIVETEDPIPAKQFADIVDLAVGIQGKLRECR